MAGASLPGRRGARRRVDAAGTPPVRARPAATVALLRPGADGTEVLLTHRPATMVFGPGLHVFPGGGVDAVDADPRAQQRCATTPDEASAALAGELPPEAALAHHLAAVRELLEEAGILLARRRDGRPFIPATPAEIRALETARTGDLALADLAERLDLVLATDALVPLSRWVTPPGLARRFDTRFFVAALPDGAEPSLAGPEVLAHEWLAPRAALDAMADGRIELWQPTFATLAQLAGVSELAGTAPRSGKAGLAGTVRAAGTEGGRGVPDLATLRRVLGAPRRARPPREDAVAPGVVRVRVGGAGGIPGAETNAYLVGHGRLVVVDPGDPNDDAVEAILGAAATSGGRIVAVALTQPSPDHAAGAESLALRLGVAIHAGAGAARRLPHGAEPLADGVILDAGDLAMGVVVTPGPDPDHVAFELADRGVVLVGDLPAPPSSRALPAVRDETAVEVSRARVMARRPGLLLPAHGDPVGATG